MAVVLKNADLPRKKANKKLKLVHSPMELNQLYWQDDQKYNANFSNWEWFKGSQVSNREEQITVRMDQN
ncbi:MAG: hypothetical protein PWQ96_1835 [Clostridia bacterium]|jgi:hypothetical protein|nr:hypothetical protein [Clostridiales bacterium]MDK2986191.1 hypothetical protein [Clostridia bacterium]